MAITKETKIIKTEIVGDYKAIQIAEDIIYKDEILKMLSNDDPELERSIKAILTNSATNDKIMKEGGVN